MQNGRKEKLSKLYGFVVKGAKPFRDEAVKPYLDLLSDYASKCRVITELGISTGCPTLVFLMSSCKKVYSYNIIVSQNAQTVKQAAEEDGVFFRHIKEDDLKLKIKMTDLLFIDTDHWQGRIKAELDHHHARVRKWIVIDNTETFGMINPFDGRPGMRAGIFDFLEEYPEWQLREHLEIGHGLTILERQEEQKKKWWKF